MGGANSKWNGRRLAFFSLGFFRPALRVRLQAMGIVLIPFGLGRHDGVIVWGQRRVSGRGRLYACWRDLPVVTVEDAFLRSIKPGWGELPLGLTLDATAPHYHMDSDLTRLLANLGDFDRERVHGLIAEIKARGLSKYNAAPRGDWHHRDYVLVIDQVRGDASIEFGGLGVASFAAMLADARAAHPEAKIIIRAHPAGKGHFTESMVDANTMLSTVPANIWDVLDGARAVYVGSSLVGFEAILAGHRPFVYGHPFYAGWGLSEDRRNLGRPRNLDADELFYGAMIAYPQWFNAAGESSEIESAVGALGARINHARSARDYDLRGFRPWKRAFIHKFFPKGEGQQILRWGARAQPDEWVVEDGFLRSRGLGAALAPPLSLVVDRSGIYYDPSRPSDLEAYIHNRASLTPLARKRAQELRQAIITAGISKYNLKGGRVCLPEGREVILVPGQVENDRSILLGATGPVKTNAELLAAVRVRHPSAYIIYKPHPDVEAGLRPGQITAGEADLVYRDGGLEALWPHLTRVATITSLTGFEALLRAIAVDCYGMPFYADWGLTRDFAPSTGRRGAVDLDGLVYATLIDYPLYYDPITKTPSTPEITVRRLAEGMAPPPWYLRAAAAIQSRFYRVRAALGRDL